MMIEDMLPTEYINAIYGEENEDNDEVTSIFEPTHVLTGGGGRDDDKEFTLFSKKDNALQRVWVRHARTSSTRRA